MADPSAFALWNACWTPLFAVAVWLIWRYRRLPRVTRIGLTVLAFYLSSLLGIAVAVLVDAYIVRHA